MDRSGAVAFKEPNKQRSFIAEYARAFGATSQISFSFFLKLHRHKTYVCFQPMFPSDVTMLLVKLPY